MISNIHQQRESSTRKTLSTRLVMTFLVLAMVFTLTGGIPTSASAAGETAILVGAGDISKCSNENDTKTAKLVSGISGTVFTTGDNVYDSGTSQQFADCYKPTWGQFKARTQPAPGNHEYQTSGAKGYFNYFGVSSYYAYNRGTWRIYALNSEIDTSAESAQVKWLKADLAKNPKKCVMAYWHRPRWSSGNTHGSDSRVQVLWAVLFDANAELVVSGHEHNYERFTPMNKSGQTVTSGLQEFVVGTGGAGHYGFGKILSASRARNGNTYGVLKLTLRPGSYDWKFIPVAGSSFTDSGGRDCH